MPNETTETTAMHTPFQEMVKQSGAFPLCKKQVTTLQLNMGKMCNQKCLHCHVNASPMRTETMTKQVADKLVQLVDATPLIDTVDFTGGAPELAPFFKPLILEMAKRGKQIINRSNLTVLLQPKMERMGKFLAANKVKMVASLPCYTKENVDAQRGKAVFEKSITVLKNLNKLGYGQTDELPLTLVYNPGGAFLPGTRQELEDAYRQQLMQSHGIEFTNLQTITNMPIGRFADCIKKEGCYSSYLTLLENNFNAMTLPGLMCNTLISVSFEGILYDCDFNQATDLPICLESGQPLTVFDVDSFSRLTNYKISLCDHCFGCTAGAGSGCFGELA